MFPHANIHFKSIVKSSSDEIHTHKHTYVCMYIDRQNLQESPLQRSDIDRHIDTEIYIYSQNENASIHLVSILLSEWEMCAEAYEIT
jgi:hypothetical protein